MELVKKYILFKKKESPNKLYIQPPNPLLLSFMKSSFKSIEKIGIENLRARSIELTGYLEFCLK